MCVDAGGASGNGLLSREMDTVEEKAEGETRRGGGKERTKRKLEEQARARKKWDMLHEKG